MNRYYTPLPTFCTSSDSGLSSGDCQEDSDCLSKDSDFDGTFSICSSASLEDLSALAPILYNCIKQEPTIAPSLEAFIYSRSHSIVKQPATFISLLALIDHYQIKEGITAAVFDALLEEIPSEWIITNLIPNLGCYFLFSYYHQPLIPL